MVPLTLAVATDALLKKEFDGVRDAKAIHPLWERFGLPYIAYEHPDLETWRNIRRGGIRATHPGTGYIVYGAVDDVWLNPNTGQLVIVDYKSTSKKEDPTLEGGVGDSYKRQLEIYQWIFRLAGHNVSPTGYFLYVNGLKDGKFFSKNLVGNMRFKTTLVAHEGDDSWVEPTIQAVVNCFSAEELPLKGNDCDTCRYVSGRRELE
ncbi:MAG: PD-(D/E)XK nuclease family protein [Gammaproteobacteria bacterium]|jgi:hypothetical protein